MELPAEERAFVETARERIRAHSQRRREASQSDRIHAVVRSESGAVYDGMAFDTSMSQFEFCAERHAIHNMQYAEPEAADLDAILVAGPVPDEDDSVTTPCGACRHVIHDCSDDAPVFCSNFVRHGDGWTMFPTLERYTADRLYPARWDPPTWD